MGNVCLLYTSGELRHISQAEQRVAECRRMGVERMIVPYSNAKDMKKEDVEIIGVKTLSDALACMFKKE